MNRIALFGKLPRLAFAAAVVLGGAVAVSAQDQPVAPLYAAAQAERGQAAYRQSCQDCHGTSLDNGEFGGPPLKGGYFRTRWGQGSVAALYGYVSLAMPPDRPGQLSPQTYADLEPRFQANGGELMMMPPARLKEFIRSEYEKWIKVIQDTGIRLD